MNMHVHIHIHVNVHVHIESVQARTCARAYLAIQAPFFIHELLDEVDVVDLRRKFRLLLGNLFFRLPLPKYACQRFNAMPKPPTSTNSTVSALCIVEIHGNFD
jgi:hypothetical protein